MNRNAIYDALVALGATLTGSSFGSIADSGRRLKMWDKAPKPALYQVEPDELYRSQAGQLTRRTLKATWVIYHQAGKDQASVPASVSADIMDAIDIALPEPVARRQTLGGLVYAAYIDGTVKKFEGDLDGQTIITVPITILVP
jgi:hypothetical protein